MKEPVIERTVCAYPFFPAFLWAGLTATSLMLALTALAQAAGLAFVDYPALLAGAMLGHVPAPLTLAWWLGTAAHFAIGGIALPVVYVYFAYFKLPGPATLKGLTWGLVLWGFAQLVVAPLLGGGVFFRHAADPFTQGMVSLAAHLVYGLTLGSIARTYSPEILGVPDAEVGIIDEVWDLRDRAA